MPGIVGLLTRMPRERAEPQLMDMLASMWHEPSYGTGTWVDEQLGVYVGWTASGRSAFDTMPVRNGRGDVALLLSGDIVPEPSTEQLAAACDDSAWPASLNGRFHGLRIDGGRGTATLFNDRYGMHRIYYHAAPDTFYFAAEAKAILACRPDLRQLDQRGLGE